jgi:LuxR family maltose regulon positive regulatory protein
MGTGPAATKFAAPTRPTVLLDRAWLVDRLDRAASASPITVVTGYAGAGKSVLLSLWFETQGDEATAWWSCDDWDSSPVRFWTSLVTALRSVEPELGVDALDLLEADSPSNAETVASLVNDLHALQTVTTLVIDDFHLVPPTATAGFAELVERLPATLRIVLASRSDPVLPLHRWRVTERLAEIRMADLRLREDEVDQLLRGFEVDLPADDVDALAQRTEGWAAGVQLAALSLRSVDDPTNFLRRFTGNDRNVADFLVGEVLQRQPPELQDFLLATSILDDFDSALCDDLADRTDSRELLRLVEASSLFLVPLDADRNCYRYHHLFRDLLRAELEARDRTRALVLHRKAAERYERLDDLTSAIRHHVAAEDTARAFDLLHEHCLDAWFTTDGAQLERCLSELPDVAVAGERFRMLDLAFASLLSGDWPRADMWLERANRTGATVNDDSPEFEGHLMVATALRLALRGEQDQALVVAEKTLGLPCSSDYITVASLILVRCYLWTDRLDAAAAICAEGIQGPPEPVRDAVLIGVDSLVAFQRGHLVEAARLAAEAISRAERAGAPDHPDLFEALYTLSGVALERGDLDDAERLCEEAIRRSEPSRPPPILLSGVLLASIWAARGDVDSAFAAIERTRGAIPGDAKSSMITRIDAAQAKLLLDLGNQDGARAAIERIPPGIDRSLLEAECSLMGGAAEQALDILDQLPRVAMTTRVELERAVLHARIVAALDQDADDALRHVLDIARPERFIRTVVSRDREYARRLDEYLIRSSRDAYGDELLPAIDQMLVAPVPGDSADGPLSERERVVLRYLPTRMTYREIAGELYVSMNTLKTHLKSIYRKLDASSRAEATEHARRRGLL